MAGLAGTLCSVNSGQVALFPKRFGNGGNAAETNGFQVGELTAAVAGGDRLDKLSPEADALLTTAAMMRDLRMALKEDDWDKVAKVVAWVSPQSSTSIFWVSLLLYRDTALLRDTARPARCSTPKFSLSLNEFHRPCRRPISLKWSLHSRRPKLPKWTRPK